MCRVRKYGATKVIEKLDMSFVFWSFRLLFFYAKEIHVNNKTIQK